MNRFEQMPQRIVTGAAVILSAVALAACGGEGDKGDTVTGLQADHGSKKIPQCPKLYAVGASIKPGYSAIDSSVGMKTERRLAAINKEINNATDDLVDSLPRNVRGQALVAFGANISQDKSPGYLEKQARIAARHILYVESSGSTERQFVLKPDWATGNIESKIDDPSEEFCVKDMSVYLSNEASRGIGDLEWSRIHSLELSQLDNLKGRMVAADTQVTAYDPTP